MFRGFYFMDILSTAMSYARPILLALLTTSISLSPPAYCYELGMKVAMDDVHEYILDGEYVGRSASIF